MVGRGLLGIFSVSLAAWLVSTPLSMHFFGRFSPVALLGNMLAVPMAFLIIVTGCFSIATGAFIGAVGEIFNYSNLVFVKFLVGGMRMLERVPYGWIDCGRLPLWGVLVWYVVLATVVLWFRRWSRSLPVRDSGADDLEQEA
jgi:competence protein ComEC